MKYGKSGVRHMGEMGGWAKKNAFVWKVANLETGEETGEETEEEEKSPCGGRFERRNLGSVACGGKHVAGQTDGEV